MKKLLTTKATITEMFRLCYEVGMSRKAIIEAYGLHHSYVYRILTGEARKDITVPLLAKYRPSWKPKIRAVASSG